MNLKHKKLQKKKEKRCAVKAGGKVTSKSNQTTEGVQQSRRNPYFKKNQTHRREKQFLTSKKAKENKKFRNKKPKVQPTEESDSDIPSNAEDIHSEEQNEDQFPTEESDGEQCPSEVQMSNSPKERKKLQKGKVIQRSEASQNISEFHLTEVGKEKVNLKDLLKFSKSSIKKRLKNARELKSLSVPLSRPQLEKIKRKVAYENTCDQVSKWESIVHANRSADHVTFPLKKPSLQLESFETVSENFISKHPVELAVSKLLKTSENVLEKGKLLTVAEEKALQAMSLKEAKLRHGELMRHRALISYQEAKARRQNKIKSKKYRRILKREKMKKLIIDFENLKQYDKAAALEKLMEADKIRILERMTLKHRNTGKWAKHHKLRAKYSEESRANLKEDLVIGRTLREKVKIDDETLAQLQRSEEAQSGLMEDLSRDDDLMESADFVPLDKFNEVEKYTRTEDQTIPEEHYLHEIKKPSVKAAAEKKEISADYVFDSEINLDSMVPTGMTLCDEDLDDKEDGPMTIDEAFADEKLLEEFKVDKTAAEDEKKPKLLSTYLPGWGSWSGLGIEEPQAKMKGFLMKPQEVPKKNTVGNVILNEEGNKKASVHQVSQLPFPFTNVHQFESYIRQPVGHTWNPQSSYQNLNAPKVTTMSGKIIEPLDSEDVLLQQSKKRSHAEKKKDKNRKRKGKEKAELKAF